MRSSSLRLAGLAGALALAVVAAYAPPAPAASPVGARTVLPDSVWTWPERSQNLRVLPDTTSAATLRRTMQGFTRALGVRCSECHVGSGRDFRTWDFASDAKPHKEVARGMMRMTAELNTRLVPAALSVHAHPAPAAAEPAAVHRHADGREHVHRPAAARAAAPEHAASAEPTPEPAATLVSCWTCHRGQSRPDTQPTDSP
ncbi:MAG TPA: c-type cytochrome [Rubricoccaceae bacterium]